MEGKKIESSELQNYKHHNYDNHVFAYHEKKEFKSGELNHIPDSEVSHINSQINAKYHVLKALQNREYNGKFPKDMKIVTEEASMYRRQFDSIPIHQSSNYYFN